MNAPNNFDTPFPTVDVLKFLVDDEIRPFILDERHDLTDTTHAPKVSNGLFIVHDHEVPKDTAEVILGVMGHCWRRTNPTSPQESVEFLDPSDYQGWVLFNWTKNNNQPFLVQTNYNNPTLSTVPNDLDRAKVAGSTFLSASGGEQAAGSLDTAMTNVLKSVYLPGGSKFRVTFQIAPAPATNPVPNPWVVGANPEPDTNNRIDFAGALVYGVRMPQHMYERLRIERRSGG